MPDDGRVSPGGAQVVSRGGLRLLRRDRGRAGRYNYRAGGPPPLLVSLRGISQSDADTARHQAPTISARELSTCSEVATFGVHVPWEPGRLLHAMLHYRMLSRRPGDISLSRLRHSRILPEGAAGCAITSSLSLAHGITSADTSESTKSRDSPNSPTTSCDDTICRKCGKGVLRQHIMAAECLSIALFCPVDPAVGLCVLG